MTKEIIQIKKVFEKCEEFSKDEHTSKYEGKTSSYYFHSATTSWKNHDVRVRVSNHEHPKGTPAWVDYDIIAEDGSDFVSCEALEIEGSLDEVMAVILEKLIKDASYYTAKSRANKEFVKMNGGDKFSVLKKRDEWKEFLTSAFNAKNIDESWAV